MHGPWSRVLLPSRTAHSVPVPVRKRLGRGVTTHMWPHAHGTGEGAGWSVRDGEWAEAPRNEGRSAGSHGESPPTPGVCGASG